MKSIFFKPRYIAGIFILLVATLSTYLLIESAPSTGTAKTMNADDRSSYTFELPSSAGHSRLSAAQAAQFPLSDQYQLEGVLKAEQVEDTVALIKDLHDGRPSRQIHLGGELTDGCILRELYADFALLDRDGRLERIVMKTAHSQSDNAAPATRQATQQQTTPVPIHPVDTGVRQELPRAGLPLSTIPPLSLAATPGANNRPSDRDLQIIESAKLPAYHEELRKRMIVPPAPDTNILATPERSVPKAQGNRLPTASYTPPQS